MAIDRPITCRQAESIIRGSESSLRSANTWWLEIMVRLKPEQSLAQANDALRGAEPTIRAAIEDARPIDPLVLVTAAADKSDLRTQFETPLVAMVVAVGLVLLVACANVAGLAFERAIARRHELGVRLALGGSRGRLARLVFAESLIVAVISATVLIRPRGDRSNGTSGIRWPDASRDHRRRERRRLYIAA